VLTRCPLCAAVSAHVVGEHQTSNTRVLAMHSGAMSVLTPGALDRRTGTAGSSSNWGGFRRDVPRREPVAVVGGTVVAGRTPDARGGGGGESDGQTG
jgi:hypothetical protein